MRGGGVASTPLVRPRVNCYDFISQNTPQLIEKMYETLERVFHLGPDTKILIFKGFLDPKKISSKCEDFSKIETFCGKILLIFF